MTQFENLSKNFNLSKNQEFTLENNIHRDTKLFYEANKRKEKGQTDLAVFELSRSNKSLLFRTIGK